MTLDDLLALGWKPPFGSELAIHTNRTHPLDLPIPVVTATLDRDGEGYLRLTLSPDAEVYGVRASIRVPDTPESVAAHTERYLGYEPACAIASSEPLVPSSRSRPAYPFPVTEFGPLVRWRTPLGVLPLDEREDEEGPPTAEDSIVELENSLAMNPWLWTWLAAMYTATNNFVDDDPYPLDPRSAAAFRFSPGGLTLEFQYGARRCFMTLQLDYVPLTPAERPAVAEFRRRLPDALRTQLVDQLPEDLPLDAVAAVCELGYRVDSPERLREEIRQGDPSHVLGLYFAHLDRDLEPEDRRARLLALLDDLSAEFEWVRPIVDQLRAIVAR